MIVDISRGQFPTHRLLNNSSSYLQILQPLWIYQAPRSFFFFFFTTVQMTNIKRFSSNSSLWSTKYTPQTQLTNFQKPSTKKNCSQVQSKLTRFRLLISIVVIIRTDRAEVFLFQPHLRVLSTTADFSNKYKLLIILAL